MSPAVLIATSLLLAPNDPAIVRMMPTEKEVGMAVVKDTLMYRVGAKITDIYNGGFEVYTDHGVQSACQQLYKSGKTYVTVGTHLMKSEKHGKDFLAYWKQKHEKSKPVGFQLDPGTGVRMNLPSSTTLYWRGARWFVIVTASDGKPESRKAADLALKAVVKKAKKLSP